MRGAFELIKTEAFWQAFGLMFSLVSAVLSFLLERAETGEIQASFAQKRWLAKGAAASAAFLRAVNHGPRTLHGFVLAALASLAILIQGCTTSHTSVALREPVEAACIAAGDAILTEADSFAEARPRLEALWARCDVALSGVDAVVALQ